MRLQDEIALSRAEDGISLRRRHLGALANDLAERLNWLDRGLPTPQATPLPSNDWPAHIEHERQELLAARDALVARRTSLVRAEEAALQLWQVQLETVAQQVRERERAHRQPAPTPRAALSRNVEAPELSVEERKPPGALAQTWHAVPDLLTPQPETRAEISRGRTITMTPAELDGTDRVTLARANKRRTARMNPVFSQVPQREPATTPPDLPTLAPATAASRHRGRAVTQPFLAALDLDGVYLKRQQVAVDEVRRLVRVQLEAGSPPAGNPPVRPEQLTYRSREGETQTFAVDDARHETDADGHWLLINASRWKHQELQDFREALDTLP